MRELYALSVRQPWAWAILEGGKDVENRAWKRQPPKHRGPLLIHAGKTQATRDDRLDVLLYAKKPPPQIPDLTYGAFVGAVRLTAVHHARDCHLSCSVWAQPDAYHLELRDPIPFPEPVPGVGQLGLWRPTAKSLDPILAILNGAT